MRRKFLAPRSRATIEPLESRQLLTVIPGFAESQVASGLNRVTQMGFAPDGRLFVSQQDGKLRVIKNGALLSTPFLSVNVKNTGESGLIGVTFDPNFATNKYVYIYYTRPDGNSFRNRVSRFTANGDVAVAGSEKVLFEGDLLNASNTWHQSGGLHFGKDGKLYISMGENQQKTPAQSLTSVLGKILRINSDGTIPADNPFYNSTTGKYRAIWSYGVRNTFTFAVQPGTGRIMGGDVGSDKWEEINDITKGSNYGWPNVEGNSSNSAYKNPFYTYAHAGGDNDDSAITGLDFYNPATVSFPSDYVGDLFFGDYGTGNIKRIDLNTKQVSNFVSNRIEITDVDIAPDGSLYYLTRDGGGTNGKVFRVRATTSTGPSIVEQPESQTVSVGQSATFKVSANGSNLTYQWKKNGNNIQGATSASYTLNNAPLTDNNAKFTVTVTSGSTSVTSNQATLTVLNNDAPVATITSPSQSFLWTGGGMVSFGGTGIDNEDGTLPASAFTWKIDLHHDTHVHPFIPAYSGVKSDTFQIPQDNHDGETNIWYRITLTVKDSDGGTHTTFKDVFPQKVTLGIATNPSGIKVEFDSVETNTPYSGTAIVGFNRLLTAPATQMLNGQLYEFVGWSDGGNRSHSITVPGSNITYTAMYEESDSQTITVRAISDAYVRDGSTYGNTNFGVATDLQVKTDGVGWNRWSYLTFDLTQFGDDISSAILRINAKLDNTQSASVPVTIYGGPSTWSESTLTWNNKPNAGTTQIGAFTVTGTTAKNYDVDIAQYLQEQKDAGATQATIVFKAGAAKSTVIVASDEATANKPALTVTSGGDTGPGPDPDPSDPISLRPSHDAYVRDGSYAGQNFGLIDQLQVKNDGVGWNRWTYLTFDLSSIVDDISSAKLRFSARLDNTQSASVGVSIYEAQSDFNESSLIWNNKPDTGSAVLGSFTVTGVTAKNYEIDLTGFLAAAKADGKASVTLALKVPIAAKSTVLISSEEATSGKPELFVEFDA